ncbi:MAG: cellulase family glycosylhydrolase, partial [Clostridia bacterium]|nr:cellulase family glycosylhydrolase [Clostridia bacterium]
FADYDEKLIFETMNEPRVVGADYEWAGSEEGRAVVNRLNAAALEAIRQTGGNNTSRYVFITGYAASDLEENYMAIEVPDDPYVMVSLHCYPGTAHRSEFADCEEKLTFEQKRDIYKKLRGFYNTFSKKGVGVCITEFGWTDRTHLDNLTEKAGFLVRTAKKFGFCSFVWDNGSDFAVIDRGSISVAYPEYVTAITVI